MKALRSNLRQRLLSNLWNLRADEILNAPSVQRFESSELSKLYISNPRYLNFVSDFEAFEGSTARRFQKFESNRCRRFERKAFKKRSTSNALRFRRPKLWAFNVERSEISTSNVRRFRRRMFIDFEFYIENGALTRPGKTAIHLQVYARKLLDWPMNIEGRKTHNSNLIYLFNFFILISILIFLFYCCI